MPGTEPRERAEDRTDHPAGATRPSDRAARPVGATRPPDQTGAGTTAQLRALPSPGARIGQYEVIRELGRGGMGAVYLARDTKLGRRVAIKFLVSSNKELTRRFLLEAQATARFSHENIVVIHEVGEHQGNPFMVLEYLEGAALGEQIKGGRKLPASRAVELMVPVVRALVQAHAHDIVHRDLKPDNIFVTDAGTIKVLDFGIAKLMSGATALPELAGEGLSLDDIEELARQQSAVAEAGPDALTQVPAPATVIDDEAMAAAMLSGTPAPGALETPVPGVPDTPDGAARNPLATKQGALLGTLPFMSPEQWGVDTVDHRTDLWAVGIILFKMLTGRHPLAPRQGYELMITAMLDQPMPSVRAATRPGAGGRGARVPDELADVIDRCLIKRKEQRMASAQELLDALEPLLPGRYTRKLRLDQSPYAGLSAFQESDAARFFGRGREIAAAVARLRDTPLLGVVGPSGVGKSSFVRAGIVPALKHTGEPWTARVVRPGRQPLAALARVVAPMVSESSSASVAGDLSEEHAVAGRLLQEPGYLGTVLRSRARRQNETIVIFVDQFEELYTLCADPAERRAFTACLASAADDPTTPLRVILSIRSDFLDRVPEDPHFMAELTRGLFFLTPPDRSGLRDALVQPAEMAGFQFESSAAIDDMLDHLEHVPGALPLLQFAATKLWDSRDAEQRLLTDASYQALGGIAGALASHADSVLGEFPLHDQNLVRTIFLRLVTPDRTRAIVSKSELYELSRDPSDVERVIAQLVRARLLIVQSQAQSDAARAGASSDPGASASVEIVHESLLHTWPLLRRWLDETQDDAAFLDQLRTAAKNWQAKNHPDGLLWRGEAMEEAQRFARRYRGELPDLQRAYLEAVFSLSVRSERRRRYAVIGIIGFLSLLVAAGAVALFLIRDAEKRAKDKADELQVQLERVEAAQRARQVAERAVETAEKVVDEKDQQLEQRNAELESKNAQLEQALSKAREETDKAESAERRARKARTSAEANAQAARRAENAARRASDDLEVLLARERERADRLEKQGTLLIEDVAVKDTRDKDSSDEEDAP